MIHSVKCDYKHFEALNNGTKTFEVRKNDRLYEVGDYLAVNEFVPDEQRDPYAPDIGLRRTSGGYYTGACLMYKITYILNDPLYCKDGMVILGLAKIEI